MNKSNLIMVKNWKSSQNYVFAQGQRKQVPSVMAFMKDALFLQLRVDHHFRAVPEGVKHRGCGHLCSIRPSASCVVLLQHH